MRLVAHCLESRPRTEGADFGICQTFAASPAEPWELPCWFRLPVTQELLSQLLGVRRTTLTITARNLQTAGLIRYRRGLIEIVDRGGLETKACECYDLIRAAQAKA